MFISKKFIPRRTFLRGAGVTLGLPLLDSMVPAQTPLGKTAAAPVRRFMGIWHRRGARILESSAGGFQLRIFIYHQTSGAVSQSSNVHFRNGHAGSYGQHRGT